MVLFQALGVPVGWLVSAADSVSVYFDQIFFLVYGFDIFRY